MQRSLSVTRVLVPLALAAWLGACSTARSIDDDEPKPAQERAENVRENAENNLAYAKDQAALWLESQQDRCATAAESERDACAAAAKASYEEQVAAAQRRYDAICRKAETEVHAASATSRD